MIGNDSKYDYLNDYYIDFPFNIPIYSANIFKNERHFLEFLIRNDWIQRQLGIKMSNTSNGLFPDIKGFVYDDSELKINVEIEYMAENYKLHKHTWGGCDLILSFIRQKKTKIVRGVPVWSFYYKKNDNLIFTLIDDIMFDFNKIDNDEENGSSF